MKEIHATQKALLLLLRENIDNPLTVRELQAILNISSPSTVQHHIEQLQKKGYLKRNPSNTKDYQILSDPERPIVYLNLYGLAQCGPNGSILDGDPIERIPITSRLIRFPVEEAFLVEAKGDSMEPKIKAGDLVIVQKKQTADSGSLVICVNNSEVLIKKYIRSGTQTILHSENTDKYEPFIANEDFKIEGVVKSIIQYN